VSWFLPCPGSLGLMAAENGSYSAGGQGRAGRKTRHSNDAEVRGSSCWALTSSADGQREQHAQPIRKTASSHPETTGDQVPGLFSSSPKLG